MKRILFIAIPEKGHINPMIGPAVWLQRMGHEVRFHAACDISPQLHAAGLEPLETMTVQPPPADLNRGAFFAEKVRDAAWLREWIRRLLIEEAPAQVPGWQRAMESFRPDVVVTDPMIYAAAIAAHRLRIPWVALSNSLNPVLDSAIISDLLDTVQALSPARQDLFENEGMDIAFSGCDMLSPWLTIAFTTQEFIGRPVPGVHMVGPSLPPDERGDETDFPWDKLQRPMIYMSFGSQIYHQPEMFRKVAEATRDMGVQLVLSVNELLGDESLADLPDHVLACRYVPQLALLQRTAAFITHGGANSVMEALRFGVPLLLSPACNDQFHQAWYVERSGTGRVLELRTASVVDITAVLRDLLQSQEVAANVRRVAASYAVDGARLAAELVERLALRKETK